jgi:hypothetical protein
MRPEWTILATSRQTIAFRGAITSKKTILLLMSDPLVRAVVCETLEDYGRVPYLQAQRGSLCGPLRRHSMRASFPINISELRRAEFTQRRQKRAESAGQGY